MGQSNQMSAVQMTQPQPQQHPKGMVNVYGDDGNNSSDDDTVYKLQTQYAKEESGRGNGKPTMADIEESRSVESDNTTLYNLQNRYQQNNDAMPNVAMV